MATVVITFFLFARFYVCKMDADCIDRQRDQLLSRREKRWSMSSQRIEQIVAELMKPFSDPLRNFNMDLNGLLEEYLTEVAVRALDNDEGANAVQPNFVEAAMLLQQSANIWGRKVDFLYQHVLDVSESLHNATQEIAVGNESESPQTPHAPRRRRLASTAGGEFTHIELTASAHARREAAAPRPPPTLPRMYIELEPRVITPADAPLHDYAGEPIGLLADFQVTWRLHEGLLVDELESGMSSQERALRPISLVELQAAIEAAAPPLPPASPPHDLSPPHSPLRSSTPLPDITPPHEQLSQLAPPPAKRERKRRFNDVKIDDICKGSLNTDFGEDLRQKLSEVHEFSIPPRWIKRVLEKRRTYILSERRRLRALETNPSAEFGGWSCAEAAAAVAAAKGSGRDQDSDDDGFFEQSSVGDSDASRVEEAAAGTVGAAGADWAAWQAGVVRRAAEAQARGGVDVRVLGERVLRGLSEHCERPAAFTALLRDTAKEPSDVSRLFLATLFLANEGKVEVIQGPAGSMNSFSLRLVSAAERPHCDDEQLQQLR